MGGVISDGVGFCSVFFIIIMSRFYRIGGSVECVLAHSPSEVSMVIPSEGCVNVWSVGGVGSIGIMPGMFSLVTFLRVRGAKRVCVETVGVDGVWVVFVGFCVTSSAVVLKKFANWCKASPCLESFDSLFLFSVLRG